MVQFFNYIHTIIYNYDMNIILVQLDETGKFNALKRKSIVSSLFDKMCEIYHTLSVRRKLATLFFTVHTVYTHYTHFITSLSLPHLLHHFPSSPQPPFLIRNTILYRFQYHIPISFSLLLYLILYIFLYHFQNHISLFSKPLLLILIIITLYNIHLISYHYQYYISLSLLLLSIIFSIILNHISISYFNIINPIF